MTALNRKLWRELLLIRTQAMAIALVVAAGVAMYVMYLGSLPVTRSSCIRRTTRRMVRGSAPGRQPLPLARRQIQVLPDEAAEYRLHHPRRTSPQGREGFRDAPLAFVGLVIATLFAAGCATMRVGTYTDRDADFSRYRTYAWAPADALPIGDARLEHNPIFMDYLQ